MVVCITASPLPEDVTTARAQTIEPVVKAGKPVAISHSGVTVIR
jgi:hypothetical protein